MATEVNAETRAAEITIPAEYLEDVRTALVAEVHSAGDAIQTNQRGVLASSQPAWDDLTGSVRMMHEDMNLLTQALNADQDTTITGDRDAIATMLDAFVRVLVARLAIESDYAPVPMSTVGELAARLTWAAGEAERFDVQGIAGRTEGGE